MTLISVASLMLITFVNNITLFVMTEFLGHWVTKFTRDSFSNCVFHSCYYFNCQPQMDQWKPTEPKLYWMERILKIRQKGLLLLLYT